jgi:flagellar assembly factor FliW
MMRNGELPRAGHARLAQSNEELPVTQAQVAAQITFPEGLVGLPSLVHHRLSSVPQTALYEIVSDEDPTIGFIAASADNVKPGTTDRLRKRGLVGEDEWVLAILAVHGEPPAITANLAGPFVIDMKMARARQLVIEDSEFPLQVPVAEAG